MCRYTKICRIFAAICFDMHTYRDMHMCVYLYMNAYVLEI